MSERRPASLPITESDARGVLGGLADAAYEIDSRRCLRYVNPALCELFEAEADDLIGASIESICVPCREEDLARAFASPPCARGPTFVVCRLRHAPERFVELSLAATPLGAAGGIVYRGVAREVTERISLERRVEKQRQQLEELRAEAEAQAEQLAAQTRELVAARARVVAADRLKTEFASNISHELRTPLNGIIGMTSLALDTRLSAEQREYLELVRSSAHSLLRLVDDVLDFSRIEANKLELEAIPFSLRECLDAATAVAARRAEEKALTLVCEVAPEAPEYLVGDPGRLRQVLANLLDNAVKFTERGRVGLTVSVRDEHEDRITLNFAVHDTGIGIPPSKQQLVFESFAQADGAPGRRFGGSGLGLAIGRRLVQLLGGCLTLESEEGRGSTFSFSLPFALTEAPRLELTPVPSRELAGLRVLIADDDAALRRSGIAELTAAGVEAHACSGGREAWQRLRHAHKRETPYDWIVLDAELEGLSGFALARRMSTDRRFSETGVILLSAEGKRGDGAVCRRLGVTGYLTKPLEPGELSSCLRCVVAQHQGDGPILVTRYVMRESLGFRPANIPVAADGPAGAAPPHAGGARGLGAAGDSDVAPLPPRASGADDPELRRELIETFARSLPDVTQQLRSSLARHDLSELARQACRLHRALGLLDDECASRAAGHLRQLARAHRVEALGPAVEALVDQLRRAIGEAATAR